MGAGNCIGTVIEVLTGFDTGFLKDPALAFHDP